MKIISTSPSSIKEAIKMLRNGGIVVFPTETAYGLAADIANKKAYAKIFKIKNRSREKSLPWIAANLAMAKKYVKFSPLATKLAKKYWPGPLTLVLSEKKQKGTIAIRVSSNKIAHDLSDKLGRPIVSTSANLSGFSICYSARSVVRQFKNQKYQPDLVLDGGRLPKQKPSTIVKIQNEKINILRQGSIKL